MFRSLFILIAMVIVVKVNSADPETVDTIPENATDATDDSNETDSSTASPSTETEGRGKDLTYIGKENDGNDNNDVYESMKYGIKKPAAAVIKCSRRFTPGACMEPINSVWTYVFYKQNCTERFGCRKSEYHNRFKSYNHCMHRCEPLREIYTDILSGENGQKKLQRAMRRWGNIRRSWDKNAPLPTTEQPDFENDNSMRPLAREEIDYGIERTVQSEGQWVDESDDELRVPYDVDSYSVDSTILDNFYYDKD